MPKIKHIALSTEDVEKTAKFYVETPSPHTPGGMKGMAEGGTIGAPATIASAVADALAGAGVDAAAVAVYPLTASKVFALLQAASRLG